VKHFNIPASGRYRQTKMVCSIEESVAAIMGAARIFSGGRGQKYLLRDLI
jgi:hypothetical protein